MYRLARAKINIFCVEGAAFAGHNYLVRARCNRHGQAGRDYLAFFCAVHKQLRSFFAANGEVCFFAWFNITLDCLKPGLLVGRCRLLGLGMASRMLDLITRLFAVGLAPNARLGSAACPSRFTLRTRRGRSRRSNCGHRLDTARSLHLIRSWQDGRFAVMRQL